MNTNQLPAQFAAVAGKAIDGFDTTAHHLIAAWRGGSERLGDAARERWDAAFEESRAQLSAETRRNASHARKVFGGYYTRGVELTAAGAGVAVDTMVQAARVAVERAVSWQQSRA
jgi:hypothetical protein